MAVLIALILSASLVLLFRIDANWDEFNFLSKVFFLHHGDVSSPLQSIHAYLFGWLPLVSEHTMDQIVAARLVMWVFLACSMIMLYRIGLYFQSSVAAIFSVLCFAGFTFIVEHGTSFRYDPIATLFLLGAAWAYLRGTRAGALVSGVLVALSLLVTIKSVLVLPALGGLVLWSLLSARRSDDSASEVKRIALFLGSGVISGLALLLAHWSHLKEPAADRVASQLGGSFQKMFLESGFLPRLEYLTTAVIENPVLFVFFLSGFFILVARAAWAPRSWRIEAIALLFLSIPLLTVLVYRNAFPYFYILALPFPSLLCGIVVDSVSWARAPGPYLDRRMKIISAFAILLLTLLLQNLDVPFFGLPMLAIPVLVVGEILERVNANARSTLFAALLTIACFGVAISATNMIRIQAERSQESQRRVLDAVFEIFPEPVDYIDRASMVSSYPGRGFFMSTWGMQNYYARGELVMPEVLKDHQPRFILANHLALKLDEFWQPPVGLFPGDLAFLKENYVHHWGPIWIPGKEIELVNTRTARLEIWISGEYRLESKAEVEIDGTVVAPGQVVQLSEGLVELESAVRQPEVQLRLNVPYPQIAAPSGPVFRGFGREGN